MSVCSSQSRCEWGEGHGSSVYLLQIELTHRLRQGNLSEAVQYTARYMPVPVKSRVRVIHRSINFCIMTKIQTGGACYRRGRVIVEVLRYSQPTIWRTTLPDISPEPLLGSLTHTDWRIENSTVFHCRDWQKSHFATGHFRTFELRSAFHYNTSFSCWCVTDEGKFSNSHRKSASRRRQNVYGC